MLVRHTATTVVATAIAITASVMPAPTASARNPIATCQKAIDQAGATLLQKAIRIQQTCLEKLDVGKLPSQTYCLVYRGSVAFITDVKSRNAILSASAKARASITKKCVGVSLLTAAPDGLGFASSCAGLNGSCSASLLDSEDVVECVACAHLAAARYAIGLGRPGYRLDPEQTPGPFETPGPANTPKPCPVAVSVVGNAGNQKVLDSGWTGLGHDATVVSDGKLTFTVDCNATTPPCGVCDVSGPIQNLNADKGDINPRRCSNDTSIKCTDNSACGSGTCAFFFGAPLPLAAGGITSCVVNQLTGPVSGTANVESGAFASTINLASKVALGPSIDHPCPTCDGTDTPNDGKANGTCNGGARNGQPCDVNGVSPIPSFGKTSLDCPPASFVGAPLSINLDGSSGTETAELTASSPNCTGQPGKKCFCPAAGTQPTQANACIDSIDTTEDDSICQPIGGSNKGSCQNQPVVEQYCSPVETFRGCSSNADCPVSGDSCVIIDRPCFLDNGVVGGKVNAVGKADPPNAAGVSNPTFAAVFCIPPVAQASINAAAGLPGLGRIQLPLVSQEIFSLPAD